MTGLLNGDTEFSPFTQPLENTALFINLATKGHYACRA